MAAPVGPDGADRPAYAGGIAVDSGMLLLVDAVNVDLAIEETEPWTGGARVLPRVRVLETAHSTLVDTGGDGLFPLEVVIWDNLVVEFRIVFDDLDDGYARGSLGHVVVPTRQLLLADPAVVEQFVPDPFEGPVSSSTIWALLRLRADRVHLDRRGPAGPADPPAILRGRVLT